MAQLGARLDGIEEVVGSNPIGSTNYFRNFRPIHPFNSEPGGSSLPEPHSQCSPPTRTTD